MEQPAAVILQQDKDYITCVKQVGVLSEEGGMPELLRATCSGEAYCVHRLDRAVGGVMVYARTKPGAAALSTAIQNGRLTKEYLAVVEGCPEPPQGEWQDLLWKDSAKGKAFVVKRVRKGVKQAVLRYQVLETVSLENRRLSLVRVRLVTGRFHQIRVQFASRQMPLLGDGKYGSRDNRCSIALWSTRITFPHPVTGAEITAEAPPPPVYPWTLFHAN